MMKEVVGVVNFIKASAVNSRLFEQLRVDHGSQFQHLPLYSNFRWLSRGKLLRRLTDLRTKVQVFLNDKKIIDMPFGFKIKSGCSKYVT